MSIKERRARNQERGNSRDATRRRHCVAARLGSSFAPNSSLLAPHRAVTLIELLITIAIIAILAAAFLGVSNAAMESAREARTKTTIGKLHSLLMEKWSEYQTRRVDINPQIKQVFKNNVEADNSLSQPAKTRMLGMGYADLRLLATRELMKLEMPDRWSDLTNSTTTVVAAGYPEVLLSYPAVSKVYLRRLQAQKTPTDQHQSAECLYLIIMNATGDGESRTIFSEQDIDDTDGDGAPEFVDGWGKPIAFTRWPAGFVEISALMSGDAGTDHDSFDPFRRDQVGVTFPASTYFPGTSAVGPRAHVQAIRFRNNNQDVSAFRLVPLIYSRGPDDLQGLLTSGDSVVGLDPYWHIEPSLTAPNGYMASPIVEDGEITSDHLDNIHNHLQDNR